MIWKVRLACFWHRLRPRPCRWVGPLIAYASSSRILLLVIIPTRKACKWASENRDTKEYYGKLAAEGWGPGLKVKQTREMGKGVYADKEFQKDELILQDNMLVGAQHFSNKINAFVCSFCFRYIGSIELQIGRQLFFGDLVQDGVKQCEIERFTHCSQVEHDVELVDAEENGVGIEHLHNFEYPPPNGASKAKTYVPEEVVGSLLNGKIVLPYSDWFPLPAVINCIGGCLEEYYCSTSCAEAAWEKFHSLLCTGPHSLCKNKAALHNFKEHADETNDIFHVAAQVICTIILKDRKLKADLHQDSNWSARSKILNIGNMSLHFEAWEPFSMGYKRPWWDCIALPNDVDPLGESFFRKQIKELAWTSLQLLREAIFEEEYAPLFSLQVYGNIIGMFELNNLDLVVASPVEDYFIYIDDLPHSEKAEAENITRSFLEALGDDYATCCQGTAFFPLQSCINHSCEPNCKAFKREQDRDGQAILIATRPIAKEEEIFISYIDEDLPWKKRQALLKDYGFVCQCCKCLREKEKSD